MIVHFIVRCQILNVLITPLQEVPLHRQDFLLIPSVVIGRYSRHKVYWEGCEEAVHTPGLLKLKSMSTNSVVSLANKLRRRVAGEPNRSDTCM